MKKISFTILILLFLSPSLFASTGHNEFSANFLAQKGIINDHSVYPARYNLDDNISRREMLKVMMNLSDKTVGNSCSNVFTDMSSSDWGCKYAEAALEAGYITKNSRFRPDDNVTQIEALKMIMQAKDIPRDDASDWRAGYVSKAYEENIIPENYLDYDTSALRGWIFSRGASTYKDFEYQAKNSEISNNTESNKIIKGELVFQELLINSTKRFYGVYIPTSYSQEKKYPVVFVFHGGGGNALKSDTITQFSKKAEKDEFILIYPQGLGRFFDNRMLSWNVEFCCGYAHRNDIDDISFISELYNTLNSTYNIDSSRVYATGFSNGGIMSHLVGVELSHIFTGIAPAGSQIGGQFNEDSEFIFPQKKPEKTLFLY